MISKTSPAIGILMLDTRFPRIKGDIGNPESFDVPVLKATIPTASPDRIVRHDPMALLPMFIKTGQELVDQGARLITTSCGFLTLYQSELQAALPVPVLTSSLMQVSLVNAMLPAGKRAGVLTISGSTLTPSHLNAAGVPLDTPIGSTESGQEFTRAILGNHESFDIDAARADNVGAALDLVRRHPEIGALVLECTNMGPYADAIKDATGLPVFSIVTLINWAVSSL